jgi:hypothetical protein
VFVDDDYAYTHYNHGGNEINTAPLVPMTSLTCLGLGCQALKLTYQKVNAYVQIQWIKDQTRESSVLPVTQYDVTFSSTKMSQLKKYQAVHDAIQWTKIGQWAVSSVFFGGCTYFLID